MIFRHRNFDFFDEESNSELSCEEPTQLAHPIEIPSQDLISSAGVETSLKSSSVATIQPRYQSQEKTEGLSQLVGDIVICERSMKMEVDQHQVGDADLELQTRADDVGQRTSDAGSKKRAGDAGTVESVESGNGGTRKNLTPKPRLKAS